MYYRRGFLGSVCRQILQPPTKVMKLPKRTQNGFSSRYEERIPPRLSLRPLANYSLLAAMSIGIVITWFTKYVRLNTVIDYFGSQGNDCCVTSIYLQLWCLHILRCCLLYVVCVYNNTRNVGTLDEIEQKHI